MRNVFIASGWLCAALVSILAWNGTRASQALATDGLHYLNPKGLSTPVARYSHVVAVPAGEGLILVSGQGGDDLNGRLVSEDVVAQTKQTMENLKTALAAAGSDFAHVVNMNIYLTDMNHMPELRKVRDAYLDPKRPPAMTTTKVLELVGGSKVEIEVMAVPR